MLVIALGPARCPALPIGPTTTPTPLPEGCTTEIDADIFMMLDRTGSMGSADLIDERAAAEALLGFFEGASSPPPVAVGAFPAQSGYSNLNSVAFVVHGLTNSETPSPYGDDDGAVLDQPHAVCVLPASFDGLIADRDLAAVRDDLDIGETVPVGVLVVISKNLDAESRRHIDHLGDDLHMITRPSRLVVPNHHGHRIISKSRTRDIFAEDVP